jgi:hypothetical protein
MPYMKIKYSNTVHTPRDHTLGIEPFSIVVYPNLFSQGFGYFCLCHQALDLYLLDSSFKI